MTAENSALSSYQKNYILKYIKREQLFQIVKKNHNITDLFTVYFNISCIFNQIKAALVSMRDLIKINIYIYIYIKC